MGKTLRCKQGLTVAKLKMNNWILLSTLLASALGDCPHEDFVEKNICDTCRGWKEALQHQKGLGVTGITTVFGPPVHTFPPLFRQTGVYANDYCINRQARPAYRCNMDAKRPYCFELGNLCYTWHSPQTGQMYQVLRMGLVKCVDDHTANLILWMISMIPTEELIIDTIR